MNKEKGAVIPLIAISLIMIMSMLTLVIDFGALVTTKSDLRDTARAAAMAGLQAYVEDLNARIENSSSPVGTVDPIYAQSLQVALEKASAITKLNLEISPASKLMKGDVATQSNLALLGQGVSAGYVIPGKWHFIEAGGIRPSCSPPAPAPFQPCFEELAANQSANALRVVLSDETGRVKSFFGEAAGMKIPEISSYGTAAFVPRQGVVAFDLSASTTRVTHLDHDSVEGKRSEYAFYIEPTSSCSSSWQSSMQTSHQDVWNDMLLSAPGAAKDHFKNNYECLSFNVEGNTESFAVEKNGSPQPLNSILDATHELLNSFAQRRVVGDKVGAFGFDLNVLEQRRLPEAPINGVLLANPVPGEANFDQFLDATNTSIPITDSRRKDRFLFPRVYSGSSTTRKVALTNIQVALKESLNMLKSSETFQIADNFVLLISDGLTNCVEDPSKAPLKGTDADGDGLPDPIKCFNTTDPAFSNYNSEYIKTGFNEIYNSSSSSIANQYKRDGVKIHVALVGDNVAPHTLVRKSPAGGCMSFGEASASNLTMVNAIDTTPYSTSTKFYFPNNFSNVASTTGGKWWPIRPACSSSLTLSSLDTICDSRSNLNPILPAQIPSLTVSNNEWDSQGRLLCSPGASSIGDQLGQLVKEIMADSPVTLVE